MLRGSTTMSPQIGELAKALSVAQANFKPVKKSGYNPHFKSNFSTLTDVIESSQEALAENGLSVVQAPSGGGEGNVCITTYLLHSSGQYISGEIILPAKNNTAQDCGSSMSYARRYGRAAILGLSSEDDDGNQATAQTSAPMSAPTYSKSQPSGVAGEYIVTFGKFKAKRMADIDPKDVESYIKYLTTNTDGKPISAHAFEFIENGNKYIKSFAAPAAEDETLPF